MRGRERPNGGITRIALLAAIIISSLLISLQRGSNQTASGLETATQETVAPLAAALAVPLRGIEGFFSGLDDRSSALADNEKLRNEIEILRDRQARYDNLAVKVARYEAILGVDTETDIPLRKIAARAIGETDGPFVRSLLLNVGAKDGVHVGNPVMSTEGLVGHVINVGPNTTRVLRVSDLNSRIAVASVRSGATAILAGDNSPLPKLSFINQRENWMVGDRVISSGDDGSLPRGLQIGEVISGEAGGLRVRLSTESVPLDWVWVSPFVKIVAPPEADQDGGDTP
ncbi:MAG: rod shape-determining protein MreC [Litorimonas sp.]